MAATTGADPSSLQRLPPRWRTSPHAARRSTAEPVVIGIQGFSYRIEALPIDPSIGAHAFSVQDLDRARIYTVHRSAEGEVVCDCGDFTCRKAGTMVACKHGRRLVELGLIPTRPTVLPPFAVRNKQPLTIPGLWPFDGC